MSDFRGKFLEDYAGGLLNVSKQEQSPTGEILAQNGFPSDGSTIFVEDGSGQKSGLKLGLSLSECLEPTTLSGIVNVSYADRTYAKIKDLKIFATATASTQAALSQATVESIQNLENAFAALERKVENFRSISSLRDLSDISITSTPTNDQVLSWDYSLGKWKARSLQNVNLSINDLNDVNTLGEKLNNQALLWDATVNQWKNGNIPIPNISINQLTDVDTTTASPSNGQVLSWDSASNQWKPATVSSSSSSSGGVGLTSRATSTQSTSSGLAPNASENITFSISKTFALLKIQSSASAWITLYTDEASRTADASRNINTDPLPGSGVIAEIITSGDSIQSVTPGVIGWNNDSTPSNNIYAKVVNRSTTTQAINITITYVKLEN